MARDGTKERMIEAAKAGFRSHGVTATGFTEIVARAGAARGAIYHHFPGGKAELVRDVVASTAADVGELIDAVFDDADSSGEAVAVMLELCARAVESHGGDFGCPVTPSVLEAAQDTSILDAGQQAFAHWEERLAAGFGGVGQEPGVAAANATLVVASIEGALVLARAERSAEPIRRVAAALQVLFR